MLCQEQSFKPSKTRTKCTLGNHLFFLTTDSFIRTSVGKSNNQENFYALLISSISNLDLCLWMCVASLSLISSRKIDRRGGREGRVIFLEGLFSWKGLRIVHNILTGNFIKNEQRFGIIANLIKFYYLRPFFKNVNLTTLTY